MGYLDLHSHVLPALDDGAPDEATSAAMLRTLREVGFERVTATPHQKNGHFMPSATAIAAAHARAAMVAAPLELGLAAENYWDDVFFQRWRAGAIPSYDGGPAFLFEIPTEEAPVNLEATLFQMRLAGKLPVMAHPERYRPLRDDPDRMARLGQQVALVVDLGAVAGYHGWGVGRAARRLVADGLAHAVASDVHTLSDVRSAAEGIAWIRKKLGADAVVRLLSDHPRAILGGELPQV